MATAIPPTIFSDAAFTAIQLGQQSLLVAETVTGLAPPVQPTDAVNKYYVDTLVASVPAPPDNAVQFNSSPAGHLQGTSDFVYFPFINTLSLNGILSFPGLNGIITGLADPINPQDAANKEYVDSISFVPGLPAQSLQFNSNPAGTFTGSSNLIYDQGSSTITLNGDINLSNASSRITFTSNTGVITGLVNPVNPLDAANKSYVDSAITLSPGLPFDSIQFNNAGILGGSASLLWNTITQSLIATNTIQAGTLTDGTFSSTGGVITSATITDPSNNVAANSLQTTGSSVSVVSTPPVIGQTLIATSATAATWQTITTGAGGLNTQIQYNNSGAFAGSSNFTWTNGSNTLGLNGVLHNTGTTNATSSITGSIITAGGIGIAKDVYISGNCYATEYFTTSDERLKVEISRINQDDLKNLANISGYSYFLENDSDLKYGFLAGELEDNGLDNLVNTTDKFKRINYQSFIPLLLEKIKTLEKRITDLERD